MKFVVTKELGKLAKWLRIFGFDTIYFKEATFSTVLIIAFQEDRIILTRNTKIGVHSGVRIITIKSNNLAEQLNQVFRELKSKPQKEKMFSRCILCNEELSHIAKEKIKKKVPEYVYKTQSSFVACPECKRVYWQGTHWGKVEEALHAIRS